MTWNTVSELGLFLEDWQAMCFAAVEQAGAAGRRPPLQRITVRDEDELERLHEEKFVATQEERPSNG